MNAILLTQIFVHIVKSVFAAKGLFHEKYANYIHIHVWQLKWSIIKDLCYWNLCPFMEISVEKYGNKKIFHCNYIENEKPFFFSL